jgi:hypothetical protein
MGSWLGVVFISNTDKDNRAASFRHWPAAQMSI